MNSLTPAYLQVGKVYNMLKVQVKYIQNKQLQVYLVVAGRCPHAM